MFICKDAYTKTQPAKSQYNSVPLRVEFSVPNSTNHFKIGSAFDSFLEENPWSNPLCSRNE